MNRNPKTGHRSPKGRAVVAGLGGALASMPTTAWANGAGAEPSVAMYTAGALGSVIITAMLCVMGLKIAYHLRLIGAERRVQLVRQLRVGFGVIFLLAAVSPYVALNFSAATVIPFVAGAGLIVTAWVWGASRTGEMDSEINPTSEA